MNIDIFLIDTFGGTERMLIIHRIHKAWNEHGVEAF